MEKLGWRFGEGKRSKKSNERQRLLFDENNE
jgi:hypothetical protein